MQLFVTDTELRPLIERVVKETLAQFDARLEQQGRLGFTEAEAAILIGVRNHVLRDARLRGEISGKRVGKRIVYSRGELLRFLGAETTSDERRCEGKRTR